MKTEVLAPIELSNTKCPIDNIGELRQIIAPFVDECPITPIRVFYIPKDEGAELQIEIAVRERNNEG